MDAETMEKLDQMEQKLIAELDRKIKNGWYNDAQSCSQNLVNIATYRRLVSGDKMRPRLDGTARTL